MENLLTILFEILQTLSQVFFVFILVCFLCPELLLLLLEAIIHLLIRSDRNSKLFRKIAKIIKYIALTLAGIFLILFLTLMVVNKYHFDSIARIVAGRIERNTGITIEFEQATGSIWTGQLQLERVRFTRQNHDISNFDIRVRRFHTDVDIRNLFVHRYEFEKVHLEGIEGNYESLAVPVDPSKQQIDIDEKNKKFRYVLTAVLPSKTFDIDEILIDELALHVSDKTIHGRIIEVDLDIDNAQIKSLFSNSPLFALLFKSQIRGKLNGYPFNITHYQDNYNSVSSWKAQQLPVEFVAGFIGGPFRWINHADLEIKVANTYRPGVLLEDGLIKMDWQLIFSDIQAQLPSNIGPYEKLIALPVVKYLQKHPDRIPFEFGFSMDKGNFDGYASLHSVGLYEKLAQAVLEEIQKKTGLKKEQIQDASRGALDKVKNYINEKRQKKLEKSQEK